MNWSGYALTAAKGSVTNALGSWTVPTVTCTSTTSYAAMWVGIDGYSSSTVEQTGTISYCQGGVANYYAWYEFYPSPMYEITSVPVSPGDKISAGISYSGSTFTVTINDVSTGKTSSTSQAVSSAQRSSAEWIAEAPSSGNSILPLANFGTAYFGMDNTGVSSTNTATIGGASGPIGSFGSSVQEITMVTNSGVTEAQPSALSTDGTSFTINWVAPSTTTTTSSSRSTTTTTTTSTTSTSTSSTATSTTTGESALTVAVSTNHGSYSPGSTVRITVKVTTPTGSAVSGASVSLKLTTPSGGKTTSSGTTNSQGTVSFTYSIPRRGGAGTYTLSATASAPGYISGSGSATFSVS